MEYWNFTEMSCEFCQAAWQKIWQDGAAIASPYGIHLKKSSCIRLLIRI
jgi:hypothetical protein